MATHKMQNTQATTIAVARHIQNSKETTMNTRTVVGVPRFGWIGRASVGIAAVALFGAIGIGLVNNSPRQDAALTSAPSAKVVAGAPSVSERFRILKSEQALQRADSGMVAPSRTLHTIPEQDRALKAAELARRLDEEALVVSSTTSARASARQRFAVIKDVQAAQRADAVVATHEAGTPAISLAYRTLKNEQMEERFAQPQSSARQSEVGSRVRVHEGYQALKEHEAIVRADNATVLAPNWISERYRTLKDAQVQHYLDVER